MAMQREKKTLSGPLLEVDFFPVWEDGRRLPTRAPKDKPSSEAQRRYNERIAKKKLIRLINENFKKKLDYYCHVTYKDSKSPQTDERFAKDIRNFMCRVKRHRAKKLQQKMEQLKKAKNDLRRLPDSSFLRERVIELKMEVKLLKRPLKYAYSKEVEVYKTGKKAGAYNRHFHLFITGGLTQDEMEDLWADGTTRTSSFRPDKFGPESAALYMAKDPKGSKRYVYSKNITQPKQPKPKDGRIKRKQVEELCTERVDDAKYWERRYKGYRLVRCYPRFNQYNGYWYLSVVMYRSDEDDPEWKWDEWNTEAGVE